MEEINLSNEHKKDQKLNLGCAILIISDSRSFDNDLSGKLIKELLEEKNHSVISYDIVKNDKQAILSSLLTFLMNSKLQLLITSGGTGISNRDITVDVLSEFFEKTIVGFGEFFRRLSWQEIGEVAMGSRAIAGVINGKLIICLPGSTNAVELALKKLILPSLGHMFWEANR